MAHIDTHAHLWSEGYLDYLKSIGSTSTDVARGIKASNTDEDLKERFRMMEEANVKMQIISATPQSPQWGTEKEAHEAATMINSLYEEIVNHYPEKFLAYGAVSLPYVQQAIEEARELLSKKAFIGIAIPTLIRDEISIGDKRFEPFFKAMNELSAVIYVHPTGCGANSPMINDFHLEWVVGAPIESMLATLQLLKNDIPSKYPNIKFHISHLGGALPFLMQRIEDNFEDWDAFKSSPLEMLTEHFWFDTANFHKPSLINAVDTFDVSHFMLGSDFPYFQDEKYTRAVTYIKESGLDETSIDGVLQSNALKLYKV